MAPFAGNVIVDVAVTIAVAVLVVDSYFVERRGYAEFREQIKAAWVPWEIRRPVHTTSATEPNQAREALSDGLVRRQLFCLHVGRDLLPAGRFELARMIAIPEKFVPPCAHSFIAAAHLP